MMYALEPREPRPTGRYRRAGALLAAVLAGGVLAACASAPAPNAGADANAATATAGAAATTGVTTPANSMTVTDTWVKAQEKVGAMTGVFGTITNGTNAPVTIVSATTEASATTELHETVTKEDGSRVMRSVGSGWTIPAGGTHELKPGGDHVMLMSLTAPLQPGAQVTVTLKTSDGTEIPFTAVAKAFSAGSERYEGGHGSGSGSMSSSARPSTSHTMETTGR